MHLQCLQNTREKAGLLLYGCQEVKRLGLRGAIFAFLVLERSIVLT